MDEFVKRPKGQRIGLEQTRGVPSGQARPIVVNTTTERVVPESEKISVEPRIARESVRPAPPKEADEEPAGVSSNNKGSEPPKPGKRFKFAFKPRMPRGKKEWIIASSILAILLIAAGGASYLLFFKKDPPKKVVEKPVIKKAEPAPKIIYSNLTGLPVTDATLNSKQVTAIQIENSPDARPQSGLKDAGIIFEAIAEGGITRFNALFQDTMPDYVGPIRSIRPYYIDWFLPFDAALAHVGGSPQGLSDIKSLGAKDLDQFANSGAYSRVNDRYAPHNVYTSIARLNELEASKGFNTSSYTPFNRKDEKKAATPTAKTIDLAISSYYYNVHYDYDATTNNYNRSEGGEAHKDERSGQQLAPKVVVAIVMGRGIDGDGQHTDYTTVSSGHMYVFQDGTVTEGTWAKASRTEQWTFTDAAGKTIDFNRGQTWFSMVDAASAVTYKP